MLQDQENGAFFDKILTFNNINMLISHILTALLLNIWRKHQSLRQHSELKVLCLVSTKDMKDL